VTVLRWTAGVGIALAGALVLLFCVTAPFDEAHWGTSIEAWHVISVGLAAGGALIAGLGGAVRRQPWLLAAGAGLALASLFATSMIIGGT
jgi:hypothetical protein